jgi:hypothetical protein
MLPGKHRIRVTFVQGQGGLLGPSKAFTLPGWYEFEIDAKPGMLYAPVFRPTEDKLAAADEMCMAEVPYRSSLGAALKATRKASDYLACVRPTADPRGDRSGWCQTYEVGRTIPCPHLPPDGATPVRAAEAGQGA